jgi:hypothetical protein
VGVIRNARSIAVRVFLGVAGLAGPAFAQDVPTYPIAEGGESVAPSMPEPLTIGLVALSAGGVGIGVWLKKRNGRGKGPE